MGKSKLYVLFIVCASFLLFISCNQGRQKAVAYNDKIVQLNDEVIKSINVFNNALSSEDDTEIKIALENFQLKSEEAYTALSAMGPYSKNKVFYTAAEAIFAHYAKTSKDEYQAITNIFIQDSITVEQHGKMIKLVKKVKEEHAALNDDFIINQKSFAERNAFIIGEE